MTRLGGHDPGSHIGLRVLISLLAIVAAIVHLVFPDLPIDQAFLVLTIVAIVPWLAPLFRSIELPGGLKFNFRDEMDRIEENADEVGLLTEPGAPREVPLWAYIAEQDPNLGLAGLRIEIERLLRSRATSLGLELGQVPAGRVLNMLEKRDAIDPQQASVLREVIQVLNKAVHAHDVPPSARAWALRIGPGILAALSDAPDGGAVNYDQ